MAAILVMSSIFGPDHGRCRKSTSADPASALAHLASGKPLPSGPAAPAALAAKTFVDSDGRERFFHGVNAVVKGLHGSRRPMPLIPQHRSVRATLS